MKESKKILYISGSAGLGHVTRDMAIANELRKINTDLDISWLAASPSSEVIQEADEKLVPESSQFINHSISGEIAAKGMSLNLQKYVIQCRTDWAKNVEVFKKLIEPESFDLIVADECYEVSIAIRDNQIQKPAPYVNVFDFIGMDAMSWNPLERLTIHIMNKRWASDFYKKKSYYDLGIFVGKLEDVPDKPFGFGLPNRREYARKKYNCVGYIFRFDPEEYQNKTSIRKKLNYGEKPLVVCAIGGTGIGKQLIELCGQAYPLIKKQIPDLHMVLVCGPRIPTDSLDIPEGVNLRGYVPHLYEHFAASDLAIIQGGGTTTAELTALRRPFLYFPLKKHFEQEVFIAERLARHQAGVEMQYYKTTPELLAEKVASNIGKEVNYKPIPADGAKKAAELIYGLL